jgi:hypothetical protein
MRSKGRVAMTPEELTGAARNLAHGLGIPVYIRDGRIYQQGRASPSYRQVVLAQRWQAPLRLKKRKRRGGMNDGKPPEIVGASNLPATNYPSPQSGRASLRMDNQRPRIETPSARNTVRHPMPANPSAVPLARVTGYLVPATTPSVGHPMPAQTIAIPHLHNTGRRTSAGSLHLRSQRSSLGRCRGG